jgi:Zn-dependent M32 family carboxypeptidase
MGEKKQPNRTALEHIIAEKIENIAERRGHFNKTDILHEVLSDSRLAGVVKGLYEKFDRKWHLDVVFTRYVRSRLAAILQSTRDKNGLRMYESYSAGESQRRWQPLRYMTKSTLRVVVAERRTLHGQIGVQIKRYEIILEALEKYGDSTRADTVFNEVLPKLRALEKEKAMKKSA